MHLPWPRKKTTASKAAKMYSSVIFALFVNFFQSVHAIKCFQCSSTEDQRKPTGVWSEDQYTQNRYEDNCGVYWPFEPDRNVPVECNSDESHTPGTFCVKITKQGPRGFIWDGRWRQVIRRCASISDTGVTGVCNWGVLQNGVYWEECYCSHDGCNSAPILSVSHPTTLLLAAATLLSTTLLTWTQ